MKQNELTNIEDIINYHIFKYAKYSTHSYEELYQIAYLGYLKAQDNYQDDYGPMTLAYASTYIAADLLAETISEWQYQERHVELKEYHYNISAKSVRIEEEFLINKIMKILPKLSDVEQDIIMHHYLSQQPITLNELADKYGVSRQWIGKLKNVALENMKSLL